MRSRTTFAAIPTTTGTAASHTSCLVAASAARPTAVAVTVDTIETSAIVVIRSCAWNTWPMPSACTNAERPSRATTANARPDIPESSSPAIRSA